MDLTTQYLGLTLRNPVVASAGPLSQTVAGVRERAAGGVGAIVMYSLFEEQVRRELLRDAELEQAHEESFAEALSYFPSADLGEPGPADRYVRLVERAASAVDVPVIASGGVGTLEHLVEGVTKGHASAVLAASIFHFGTYTVAEAHAALRAAGLPARG